MVFLYGVSVFADYGLDALADCEQALREFASVDDAVGYPCGGLDDELGVAGFNGAAISHLASGLGVEAGLIQNESDLCTGRDLAFIVEPAGVDPAENFAFAGVGIVLL